MCIKIIDISTREAKTWYPFLRKLIYYFAHLYFSLYREVCVCVYIEKCRMLMNFLLMHRITLN